MSYFGVKHGRAGAAGCQNYQPGCQKKNLAAKRQKNRSRVNAFAEVLPRRPKFGVMSEKIENSDFVMATSGVPECNSHFKYPKISPAALKNSEIWLQIVVSFF